MFDSFSDGLKDAFSFIDRGKLTESNIREGMRKVRQALLEADVNYDVAQDFINKVTEKSIGDKVLKSLKPSEHIVQIVYEELTSLMGGEVDSSLHLKSDGITILMMCGLQGSGKTTTCGKLAKMLKESGWNPMLVAADLQRPAAIEQLKQVGGQVDVPVYTEDPAHSNPVQVCQNGLKAAKKAGDIKVLILDTAGRLHVDGELMAELELIDKRLHPDQALLVCDAMTGQDAVNSAKVFNDSLELDGLILTKLDGDTRGGAALSIKAVTGVPIKYIGVGEKLDALEEFHPDRMAGRILGGGDMATLLEKTQTVFDADEMAQQQEKMSKGEFTLADFRTQMSQIKKLGSMRSIMKMIPGMGGLADLDPDVDPEAEMKRVEGIIDSMTPFEREHPDKIDRNRRNRIAIGCGQEPSDVNNMLKQFNSMASVMKGMSGMGMRDRMKAMKDMGQDGMFGAGASGPKEKQRSKRGPLNSAAAKEKKKKQRKKADKARKKNKKRK